MRSTLYQFGVAALLVTAMNSCDRKSASHHIIHIGYQNQLYRPAEIVELDSGVENGIAIAAKTGILINQGDKSIRSYRLGWRIGRGQQSEYQYGQAVDLGEPLPPGAKIRFPSQGITMPALEKIGADSIKFFVAEVRFSDGSSWHEQQPPLY